MGKRRKYNDMVADTSRKCCCSCHQDEHQKRWEEYRNSQSSTDDSSQGLALLERDIWVQANQDSKGRAYGFGPENSKLKSLARLSVSTRSSSVKNYDACGMATHFNENAYNQVERESTAALLKKVDDLASARKKDKSKMKMMWEFIKCHTSGPSNEPPPHILSSDDEDDGDGAPPDGDDLGGTIGDASGNVS